MTHRPAALELRSIEKRYGTIVALAGASLTVAPGTLHVLLGENGAGKTTLLQIAAGLLEADAGTVLLHGVESTGSLRSRAAARIGVVHQHFSLVPAMTVAENVALSERRLFRHFSPAATAESVQHMAESVGLHVDPHAIVGDLSVALQQRTEILKAVAHRPDVLILDEPTAVLSPADAGDLFRWLRTFVATGCTAVVITHRIRDALDHADAVTVLRVGQTVHAGVAHDITEHGLLSAIVGEPAKALAPLPAQRHRSTTIVATPVLELHDVTVRDQSGAVRLSNASIVVHAGEIVGVAGVDGSGCRELLGVLSGRILPDQGRVVRPADVGFVPQDRLRDAIIADASLVENFALRGSGARKGVVRWGLFADRTTKLIQETDVRGGRVDAPAAQLSGGNQQRFVLARELDASPPAIVAENPTRGLDVRATTSVVSRLRAARNRGAAVVLYSSDVEQLLECADRIVVCHAGRVRDVPRVTEAVAAAMVGTS